MFACLYASVCVIVLVNAQAYKSEYEQVSVSVNGQV